MSNPHTSAPICPDCDIQMRVVTSKFGKPFYGCPSYPRCDRTEKMADSEYGDD